jgi:hypothetical protein
MLQLASSNKHFCLTATCASYSYVRPTPVAQMQLHLLVRQKHTIMAALLFARSTVPLHHLPKSRGSFRLRQCVATLNAAHQSCCSM